MSKLVWLKPFIALVPDVIPPGSRMVTHGERLTWTTITLLIYLVCCQVPLYGLRLQDHHDPLQWLRTMIASNRGTLMELGIMPIVTSGLMLQLLSGSKAIVIDTTNQEQRMLFRGLEKLLSLFITLMYAIGYVMSGMYGDVWKLGIGNIILIITQLFIAGVLVLLLNEMLTKGYGMGSGISLFIATNICEQVIWRSFSPTTYNMGKGPEFEGAIIATLHLLITRGDKVQALREAFYRPNLPNLTNLLATAVVFIVVIYFQGFRVELPLRSTVSRGQAGRKLPIKLFYTSNIPVILQTALVSNLYTLSQLLSRRFPGNLLVRLFGDWRPNATGQYIPTGGVAYYLSPPRTLTEIITDPIHSCTYVLFILGCCAVFSRVWIDISGASPNDVARALKQQNLVIKNYSSDAVLKVLNRYIPVAAAFGGMCIGLLSIFAEFLGALGTGTGILLAVSIISNYYEMFTRQQRMEAGLFQGVDWTSMLG